MKTVILGNLVKTKVKFYQDIDETPIELYNLFNEFSLKDSGIGNTMSAIDKRHVVLATLIMKDRKEDALQELNNMYQTYWSILNHINYKSLCFGTMVHSIDDNLVTDHSEDNLMVILADLSNKGLTMEMVKEEVESLKKNFSHSSN